MSLTYTVDSRIPVSPDVNTKDPSHPNNVVRDLNYLENQAAADAKYDVPAKRKYEAFDNRFSLNTYLIVFGSSLFILYGVYTSTLSSGSNSKQSFQFFFFVLIVVAVFLFATRFIRVI
jgi:hypothetical protein